MEHIEGLTRWQLVELDGPQPPGRVIALLLQICASLAEAHPLGLIHRDVKPDNVLVCVRGLVRPQGAAPMTVTAHDAAGAVTWTFDATGTRLATASPRAATVYRKGSVVVAGARDVGGTKHAFVARFWP